jgi:hypothetical protein
MIDNQELEEILDILENYDDEVLAVQYLKRFNDLKSKQGKLILNLDKTLTHDDWKKECDKINLEIIKLVSEIKKL